MNAERGSAAVNGTHLYYEVAGQGEPVVLVHGFALDHRMWDGQWAALAAQYRVVRYDMRGFGMSALPEGIYAHSDDHAALMDFLGIERAHVCGFSRGGMAAIDFALEHPERTCSLIAADAVLSGYHWSADWRARWRAMLEPHAVEAARHLWLAHPLFTSASRQEAVSSQLAAMVADYSGWHWLNPESLRRSNAAERLEQLRVPTLSVLGENDLPDFHAIADLLVTRAGAQKAVIAGVGHMSPMEDPATFNRIVLDFLAAHRGRG